MQKLSLLILVAFAISGCSSGGNSKAAELCKAAVQERMTDANATFHKGIADSAVTNADGTVVITSSYSGERSDSGQMVPYTQTFTCSVALKDDQGKDNPRVIRMQINW